MASRAVAIGLSDSDVQAGVAHDVARVREPLTVAQFGEYRDRAQLTGAVVGFDQRLTAGLPTGVETQLARERGELDVETVDQRERDAELLAGGCWQGLSGEPLAPGGCDQVALVRGAVMVEHGLDTLLALGTLMGDLVAQANPGAQVEDMLGRNP